MANWSTTSRRLQRRLGCALSSCHIFCYLIGEIMWSFEMLTRVWQHIHLFTKLTKDFMGHIEIGTLDSKSGWWFGCHLDYFPINIGLMSSSQLTTSNLFQRGGEKPPTRNGCQWPWFSRMQHFRLFRLQLCYDPVPKMSIWRAHAVFVGVRNHEWIEASKRSKRRWHMSHFLSRIRFPPVFFFFWFW